MQDGDLDADVAVRSGDELGVLGGAFSSMARAIRSKNEELQATARDEATVRARLEAVITGMSEALLATDADGQILEINRAGLELLQLERTEAVGRPVGAVVRWRREGGSPTGFEPGTLVDGEVTTADLLIGEQTVPVAVTTGTLRGLVDDDAAAGMVVVLRDVRRERQVDDLKSSILSNIGHELRTPLTPIKGYAGMLRDRRLTEDQTRGFAAEIVDGVDQLERVIGQLVTFATIAAGRLDLALVAISPADLGAPIERRWRDRIGPPHSFAVEVENDAPTVAADPQLLGRAIDELVDNAVKYSPGGGAIRVRVAGGRSLEGDEGGADGLEVDRDRTLTVTVTDEGVGIEPARLDDLVGAFAQGDASATRRFGGLGLGLASADRIVRAHGGTLAFRSTVGKGTVASFCLPAAEVGKDGPR